MTYKASYTNPEFIARMFSQVEVAIRGLSESVRALQAEMVELNRTNESLREQLNEALKTGLH